MFGNRTQETGHPIVVRVIPSVSVGSTANAQPLRLRSQVWARHPSPSGSTAHQCCRHPSGGGR